MIFREVGNMRLSLTKSFGLLFGACTAFYVAYFLWSFFYEGTTVFQLIQRGMSILVFAYITYAIHSDIRSRVRYGRDEPLYKAVEQAIHNDLEKTHRIPLEDRYEGITYEKDKDAKGQL